MDWPEERRKLADEIQSLLGQPSERMKVYVIGSFATFQGGRFNVDLSDIDLLFVPRCRMLHEYVEHFQQLMYVNDHLNRSNKSLVETFTMSSAYAYSYFNLLPVVAGSRYIHENDLIFGLSRDEGASRSVLPSEKVRKKLYHAHELLFRNAHLPKLPIADTSQARKYAKLMLRELKIIACAASSETGLSALEDRLFSINNFHEIKDVNQDWLHISASAYEEMQRAYEGVTVSNWPGWMEAQEEFVESILNSSGNRFVDASEYRLYEGMVQARDLLSRGLKEVFRQRSNSDRVTMVNAYINEAAGIMAKLALAGVTSLAAFDDRTTPGRVLESYSIMTAYLQGKFEEDLKCLAAATVLLEYGLEQSVVHGDS